MAPGLALPLPCGLRLPRFRRLALRLLALLVLPLALTLALRLAMRAMLVLLRRSAARHHVAVGLAMARAPARPAAALLVVLERLVSAARALALGRPRALAVRAAIA